MSKRMIQVHERLSLAQTIPLSIQHLFAMFGATVLVPFLFHVNPATSLLMNGIGTIIYLIICQGKVPAYLGSSFAFIPPVLTILAVPAAGGYAAAQGGFIVFALVFILFSQIIRMAGTHWIDVILPPAAMGAIVIVIGLELAPTATNMAGLTGTMMQDMHIPSHIAISISVITLAVTIFGAVLFRGFFAVIPILIGMTVGYLAALLMGIVDLTIIYQAPWFTIPPFYKPVFHFNAILLILPVTLVVLAEHVGHLVVTSHVIQKDLVKDPGLHRSLLGDGISNLLSGLVGATPNTTYGENIGVMAITKVFSVWVIGGAAVLAIFIAFIGKMSALIHSVPVPVIGGVAIFLFGVIAAMGIRMLIEKQVDYTQAKNLALTSIVLISGVSGAHISIASVEIKGMVLGTLVAVIFSLILHVLASLGWQDEYALHVPEDL
ncbi:MAG: uracil permease [Gammaproteobacteria bacterium RIFCSPHIGHO2_12_FULL_42_13]|nr:MAG: uracil permease [Gammaproteobacteria bacterium RIFCSPHIGHO2_12_FULL_42_13]